MKKIINNIPNIITISRIVSCILGATFFISGNIFASVGCYIYGAISDAVDGFLARKLNAITDLGKKLDPISDKLYALSLMIPSIVLGNYLMLVPLFLEGIISSINVYSEIKYQKTYTEKVGKLKTILLFPTMILGLLVIKFPNLHILFLPSFVISSDLQAKSIVAYNEQLNKIKKNVNNKINKVTRDISSSEGEKITSNYNLNNQEIKEYTINNSKKLIRKKD